MRNDPQKNDLKFEYDPTGNRIAKHVWKDGLPEYSIYYIRDAQGNFDNTPPGSISYKHTESNIYGSSRLSLVKSDYEYMSPPSTPNLVWDYRITRTLDDKDYELTNHLGNVQTVITPRKEPFEDGSNPGEIAYFEPDIISANDYYPFGAPMPERTFNSGNYRYGFNAKENDNEVKGIGNQQDYGMRVYDPRLGRFLSVDPLFKDFAFYTPYQFSGNKPIWKIDLDGLEEADPPKNDGKTKVEKTTADKIIDFGKSIAEGAGDPVIFTITSFTSNVSNTFVGLTKKIEREGFIKALDNGGIDVLSDKEKFYPRGFSFEEGFKKEDPRFSSTGDDLPLEDGKRVMKGTLTLIAPLKKSADLIEFGAKFLMTTAAKTAVDLIPENNDQQEQGSQQEKDDKK